MPSDESTRTSRREFLTGRSALEAAADVLAGRGELPPPSSVKSQRPTHLLEVAREAMACTWEVILPASEHARGAEGALEALDLVETLEDQLTVFRSHSEVSRLNQTAAREAVLVEGRLFELLTHARQLHEQTGRAFDITSAPLTKCWGFYRREGRVPTADEIAAALDVVGSRHLLLDRDSQTVRFARPGVEINLGAIGKGYTLDRCGELLRQQGVANALLHGGNSSILAIGDRYPPEKSTAPGATEASSNEPRFQGWRVALRHPLKPQQRLAEIRLENEALGTSGTGNQYFHHQGKRYGHILDPRTGQPASGVLSATVIAPSAADADALSTACFVLGLSEATQLITQLGLRALLVTPGPGVEIELHPINLPSDRWTSITE